MQQDSNSLRNIILTRILRLNAFVHAVVVGLVIGLGLFAATNWLLLKGGPIIGPHLALLGQFLPGYHVTFVGSLIGLAYGFTIGFGLGYAFAFLYNLFVELRTQDQSQNSTTKRV